MKTDILVMVKGKIGVMLLQAKECKDSQQHQKLRRGLRRISLEVFEELWPC